MKVQEDDFWMKSDKYLQAGVLRHEFACRDIEKEISNKPTCCVSSALAFGFTIVHVRVSALSDRN
jgi:hypothetical protein